MKGPGSTMNRRDALTFALRSGAVLSLVRVPSADASGAAEAAPEAAPSVEFQKGKLSGGEFEGWEAVLAITGRAVRGTIYDPNGLDGGRITGYRVRGTATGKVLDLDFFAMEDVGFDESIGGGRGKEKKNGKTTTNFEVEERGPRGKGKKGGQMVSKEVPVSARDNRELAGTYRAIVTDPNTREVLREFRLSALANGKFTLSDAGEGTGEGAPISVAGRFGAARDGAIFATLLLPKIAKGELPFDPSEVNIIRPITGGEIQALGSFLEICGCQFGTCGEPSVQRIGIIEGEISERTRPLGIDGATVSLEIGVPTVTDLGAYFFLDVPYGSHTLTASNGTEYLEERVSIDLQAPKLVINVKLRRRGAVAVAGHIEATGGQDVAGVTVALHHPTTDALVYSGVTNSGGNYSISGVMEGDYRYRITKERFDSRARLVTVRDQNPFEQNFILTPTGVRLQDSDFADSGWSLTKLFENGLGAAFSATRQSGGGNPGAFRRTNVTFTGTSRLLVLAHLFQVQGYDPSTQGEIVEVSYAFDSILVAGGGKGDHATHALLIRQGGHWFFRDDSDESEPARAAWTTYSGQSLVADDFTNFSSLGPAHPDFSATGTPLHFGYLLQCQGTGEVSGVDNWTVFVSK